MAKNIFLLWNPINVIEGEGKWIAIVLLLFCLCWFLTKLFQGLISRIQKYPNKASFRCALESLYLPGVTLLWLWACLVSLDMVTEHWFSEAWGGIFFSMLKVATVLAFGWFLFRYKKQFIANMIETRQKEDPEIREVLLAVSKMLSIVIVIAMLLLLHDSIGLNMATLLAFGGMGGLAFAFASQEIVQNFFGGFMLHMTRPFFHGDTIVIPQNNIEGSVERIGWYQTLVRSNERFSLYVPNAVFTRACVLNKSRINGRLLDSCVYVDMPKGELFDIFCVKLEEALRTLSEVNRAEKIVVWIEELHGKAARIRLQAVVYPMSLQTFYHLQTHVMLLSQTVAEALDGSLTTPPTLVVKV